MSTTTHEQTALSDVRDGIFSGCDQAILRALHIQSLQEETFSADAMEAILQTCMRQKLYSVELRAEQNLRISLERELQNVKADTRSTANKLLEKLASQVEATEDTEKALLKTCDEFSQCQQSVENLLAERKILKKQIKELSKPGKKPVPRQAAARKKR